MVASWCEFHCSHVDSGPRDGSAVLWPNGRVVRSVERDLIRRRKAVDANGRRPASFVGAPPSPTRSVAERTGRVRQNCRYLRSQTLSTSRTSCTPLAVGARRRLPLASAPTGSSGSGVRAVAAPNETTERQHRITGDALAEAAPNGIHHRALHVGRAKIGSGALPRREGPGRRPHRCRLGRGPGGAANVRLTVVLRSPTLARD